MNKEKVIQAILHQTMRYTYSELNRQDIDTLKSLAYQLDIKIA